MTTSQDQRILILDASIMVCLNFLINSNFVILSDIFSYNGKATMEKRHAKRITAGYNARIIYSTASYDGIIDNLSETGANIITCPVERAVDFRPGESIELKFEAPSGEVLNMQCKIKWSNKIHPYKVKNTIGMKIIDPQWEKTACFL